jgi:methylenetetrahydrofolate dehydrogenase (NADP+)/methenyltetrahydrofolate cyclohydrolase
MSARIIDGVALGRTIRQEVAAEITRLKATGMVPGLAVVLVGEDPASRAYVSSKEKACLEAGMHSVKITRDASLPEAELLAIVDALNRDPAVHGILVQLPLPKHINSEKILNRIDPFKDVDGFHPVNVGKLVIGDPTALRPCTPWGVINMLVRNGIETRGAHAVIVGRSTIVGKPMANLLIQQGPGGDATVTVCHS